MNSPQLTVIIPCYNGAGYLDACMVSLKEQTFQDFVVILVDDASTDNSHKKMQIWRTKEPRIKILQNKQNKGYVSSTNRAFRNADTEFIFIMNIDMTLAPDCLERLFESMKEDSQIALVIPWLTHEGVKVRDESLVAKDIIPQYSIMGSMGMVKRKYFGTTRLIDLFYTGVFLLRKKLVRKLFDESYVCYGEDVALCWRLRLRGYQVVLDPLAIGYHVGGHALKEKKMSDRAVFHGTKNRLMNFLIFYEKTTLHKIMPLLVLHEIMINCGQPKRISLRYKSYVWLWKHHKAILKNHQATQKTRKITDLTILQSMSYKFGTQEFEKNLVIRIVYQLLNAIAFLYTSAMSIKTQEATQ